MKLRTLVGIATATGVAVVGSVGCSAEQPSPSTAEVPTPVNGAYALTIQVSTPSGLPKCTSALSGTVAYVSSPSDLWACSGGTWCEIKCSSSSAGDVAYSSSPQALVACVSNTWTQVTLPQGPKGPQGTPDRRGLRVPKDRRESPERPERRGRKEQLGRKGFRGRRAHRDRKGLRETPGRLEPSDHKGLPVLKAFKAPPEKPGHPGSRDRKSKSPQNRRGRTAPRAASESTWARSWTEALTSSRRRMSVVLAHPTVAPMRRRV